MSDWKIFTGASEPHDGIRRLPPPPNWRDFTRSDADERGGDARRLGVPSGAPVYSDRVVRVVNAALYLRRPLLVTGNPGAGKSTLADAIARELRLGRVLRWRISTRTTLRDGLYEYDAIGRLHDENLGRFRTGETGAAPSPTDVGRYIRLGPLGTALLPGNTPRVLLVDEVDKGDVDLPNDLLHVFEDGQFEIPELVRLPPERSDVTVMTADEGGTTVLRRGVVNCRAFPVVVLTSNGERDFPPAFLRRCIRLTMEKPTRDELNAMVLAHFGEDAPNDLIDKFLTKAETEELASDQLLNLVYLTAFRGDELSAPWTDVVNTILHGLDNRPR